MAIPVNLKNVSQLVSATADRDGEQMMKPPQPAHGPSVSSSYLADESLMSPLSPLSFKLGTFQELYHSIHAKQDVLRSIRVHPSGTQSGCVDRVF